MKSLLIVVTVALVAVACVNSSAQEPVDVVQRFVRMDVEGKRLSPDGWREADQFFTRRNPPPREKNIVIIAKRYAVSHPRIPGDDAYYMGYEEIGRLDSSLHFHRTASKVETRLFRKFAVRKYRAEWKIQGSQPTEMYLTPKVAIRYLTEMADKSTDPKIKRNASSSIAILMPYE